MADMTNTGWPCIGSETLQVIMTMDAVCVGCDDAKLCFTFKDSGHICQQCLSNLNHDTQRRMVEGPGWNKDESPF